jgi:hypothetical protein
MSRKILATLFVVVLSLVAVVPTFAAQGGRAGSNLTIYVTSQDKYYDSIVGPDLPQHGRFQKLEMGGPGITGLQTEFGPGDPGYLGGRWWLDLNGDNEMNEGDAFFSCPLLGPGRDQP